MNIRIAAGRFYMFLGHRIKVIAVDHSHPKGDSIRYTCYPHCCIMPDVLKGVISMKDAWDAFTVYVDPNAVVKSRRPQS